MARRGYGFDPAKAKKLLKLIQAGAFPEQASVAVGLPVAALRDWLRIGTKAKSVQPYRAFVGDYQQACGLARVTAEIAVKEKDPKFWLTKGPGKDKPDLPGWSRDVKPFVVDQSRQVVNVLGDPVLAGVLSAILEALRDFPEAKVAAARAIRGLAAKPVTLDAPAAPAAGPAAAE